MNDLIYKIKNKFFNISKEAIKLKRPSYKELIKFEHFKRQNDNKLALSFGAGRSGQNWFSKIFNSHPNWVGTCERFADFEAFYRFISYYNLQINKEEFFKLFDLASKRDMAKYQNSFISSPYFSFGVEELTNQINPNYIFFNLRNPVQTIESLHTKGWYLSFDRKKKIESPQIDISESQYRSFSRIIPKGKYLEEWTSFTRIGKITWFWSTVNKAILNDFNKIQNIEKIFIKLEDINQKYNFYENLSNKFSFKNKMTKSQFMNVVNKAPNKGNENKHLYKNWSTLEKKEYENILNELFPNYDEIKTNL